MFVKVIGRAGLREGRLARLQKGDSTFGYFDILRSSPSSVLEHACAYSSSARDTFSDSILV